MIRVTSTDPGFTRRARSMVWAEERARRLALLVGEAAIEQRTGDGEWRVVDTYRRTAATARVTRGSGKGGWG